jgi:hypothetical protein
MDQKRQTAMMAMNNFSQNEYQVTNNSQRPLAHQMFNRSRARALLAKFKAIFTGKGRMPALNERIAGHSVRAQRSLGLRTVEIERIAGTESRADDFDAEFNPRDDRIRERWVGIATQRLRQAYLPAVELIQVGSEYFVRDGHHRISVARALGNAFIDALVTVIETD